jgi:hypothetical protein
VNFSWRFMFIFLSICVCVDTHSDLNRLGRFQCLRSCTLVCAVQIKTLMSFF